MKRKQLLLLFLLIHTGLSAQLNTTLVDNFSYSIRLNDVWGYATPDRVEYALVGARTGVSIVSLANPTALTEVAFVEGESSNWRDIKTWQHYAYVVNEGGGGLQIIDLSNLPNSVSSTNWTFVLLETEFQKAHNIFIDEFGIAYITGSNVASVLMLDLASNPEQPRFIGTFSRGYTHDTYVRNNFAYNANINDGEFHIIDIIDKENPLLLATQSTPFEFTHNTWLSDDSKTLFTSDERANATIAAYDISEPNNIQLLDEVTPLKSQGLGGGTVPHNVFVKNDFLVISFYTDGVIIVDASRPTNLIEVGNYDTFLVTEYGFNGCWGVYPFLPSGLILATDRDNGLFVIEPNYVRACHLEGTIRNSETNADLYDVRIKIDANLAVSTFSDLEGSYKTGIAAPGIYEVLFEKEGFHSKIVEVDLQQGMLTPLDVILVPITSTNENFATTKQLFSVHPNPFTDALEVQLSPTINKGQVVIYNILGQKVFQQAMPNTGLYVDKDLAKGTYFIQLRTEDFLSETQKIIKE